MASGFGLNGGPGRCFPYWQDLLSCYIINTANSEEDGRWKCVPQKADYVECLHHGKEIAKTKAIRAAYLRRAKDSGVGFVGTPEGGKPGDAKSVGVLSK
ncbi:hypothetical protein FPQ18DRAFT_354247 [Pyronema domesticum]|uniref:NADH dehydrogenase [ubiquinone] iron-sulfur protein 5 n=1 Tax=Pyronema omphalodes (strain CBS 100304) TaxID=1076935 RepID=U4LLJ7_PYROM|nr:hypothetical protein FPQ18DRAFT_354247 [Pyronema domesticum]CCX30230.1 Similar to NADH dehydrogenase [ubiquinone] iron-sulfur protein 5-B; acc. no. Q9LZI6 [Pyronema omphalodes CBS 100304]